MSTHNICFCRKLRKLFTRYPLLSRPMLAIQILFLYHISNGSNKASYLCTFITRSCLGKIRFDNLM